MKIGFCGTVSCGKTSLVKYLSSFPQFEEYSTIVERSKYLRDLGIPLNTDSTLKGQTIFLAERCSELINPKLITDRTVIDVIAFTLNAKSINWINKQKFEYYASQFINEYDYIFYISPVGVPIEENHVRATDPLYREQIDLSVKNLLNYYSHLIPNLYYIPDNLTLEQRSQFVLEKLNF